MTKITSAFALDPARDPWIILAIVAAGFLVALWLYARPDDSTKY